MQIVQPRDALQRRHALAVLMARPDMTAVEVEHQIDVLAHYADKSKLSLEHCLAAWADDRCIASCLCIDSPGKTTSVFLPLTCDHPRVAWATVELLKEAAHRAEQRGLQFLQGMVATDAPHEAGVYRQAGFQLLTQLIYLETDPTTAQTGNHSSPAVTWTKYRPETHELFARVVLASYEDSLDCGLLNGVRNIEDVLASHKAAGQFNPDWWLVGSVGEQPVGVILLSQIRERWCCEVVYMGLAKRWRGQGYGATLLRRAFEIARHEALMTLTLTVDYRNDPALRLYMRFGFREVARREVWIRLLRGCELNSSL